MMTKQSLLLLLGDWLVLLLFVFIGQQDHQISGPGALTSLLTTTFSLALPWSAAAFALGAFHLNRYPTLLQWLGRALTAWLIAAPLGLLLRSLVRGQGIIATPFMMVVLGLGGLFILGWRALFYWLAQRNSRAAAA